MLCVDQEIKSTAIQNTAFIKTFYEKYTYRMLSLRNF